MKQRKIGVIVAALSALGPFSVDAYFPSFPALAAHLQVTFMAKVAMVSGGR